MPELSRSQLVVYGAIGVVVLLLGVRWVRDSEQVAASSSTASGVTVASTGGGTDRRGGGVVVHVAGAVRRPGVYELAHGARVADAVEEAGGTTRAAAADGINLAAALADGQQVVVPSRSSVGGAGIPGASASAADGPISLGMATIEQLETIDGIGPVTAAKIIEFRNQNGGVGSIEELEAVHGIGPATIERLRERLQP